MKKHAGILMKIWKMTMDIFQILLKVGDKNVSESNIIIKKRSIYLRQKRAPTQGNDNSNC